VPFQYPPDNRIEPQRDSFATLVLFQVGEPTGSFAGLGVYRVSAV
jgi:hypothetical protein